METEEEPIAAMASFMYSIATSDDKRALKYEALPVSRQYYWQRVAAQAWEIYWAVRERRESQCTD